MWKWIIVLLIASCGIRKKNEVGELPPPPAPSPVQTPAPEGVQDPTWALGTFHNLGVEKTSSSLWKVEITRKIILGKTEMRFETLCHYEGSYVMALKADITSKVKWEWEKRTLYILDDLTGTATYEDKICVAKTTPGMFRFTQKGNHLLLNALGTKVETQYVKASD